MGRSTLTRGLLALQSTRIVVRNKRNREKGQKISKIATKRPTLHFLRSPDHVLCPMSSTGQYFRYSSASARRGG